MKNGQYPAEALKRGNLGRKPTVQELQLFTRQLGAHGKNIYQQLPLMQPGAQINYDISHIADEVQLHTHTFYEILFVCQGHDVQYLLNNNRYRLRKGDIVLIPPGMSHKPCFLDELTEPYERFALWIDQEFFDGHCRRFPELGFALEECRKADNGLLRSSEATYSGLYAGFNTLWLEQKGQRYGWQAAVALGAVNLMVHISRTFYNQNAAVAQIETRSLFDEAFHYIDNHLTEKLTLEYVAGQLHVSQSTISHLFQKQLGVSFYHCVIQRRLIRAKNMILQGTPLRQAAEESGFSDYSSFYRLFKKEYGFSPREFFALLHGEAKRSQG